MNTDKQEIHKQDQKTQIAHEHGEQKSTVETTAHTRSSFARIISQRKFTLLFILMIIIVIGLIAVKTYQPSLKQPVTIKRTVMKQTLVTRSKDKGIINRSLTGKAIDVNTGKIVKAARIFSPDDKTVYLELDFNNAPKGTVIDYIRYKKGRYVDHGEIIITKDNTQNTLFSWTINSLLANAREGRWRVATYANGILAKRINYEAKSNKVTNVMYGEPIGINDPDYNLSHALFLASNKGY